jgi:integrase
VWKFSWWATLSDGKRHRLSKTVGPLTKYRTKEAASRAVNGLRALINEEGFRRRLQEVTLSDVIDHFFETVLFNKEDPYSASTRYVIPDVIERWIRPQWGSFNIRDIRVKAVKHWLRNLRRQDGEPLANSTKAHIKRVMRRLFNHAIECEWLEQGKNVIKLVKQSSQRVKEPDPFEPEEIHSFLDSLVSPFKEIVIVALAFGLRLSELFALKWRDFNFDKNTLTIERSIVYTELGICKTRAARATLPMTRSVAIKLLVWRKFSRYPDDNDWVFPSIREKGTIPMDGSSAMADVIRPTAQQAGIAKRVHWHAFRYTYATWLVACGADIGVFHQLMRHASARITIDFYVKARKKLGLVIQDRIAKLLFPGVKNEDLSLDDSEIPDHVREEQKREAQEQVTSMLFGDEIEASPVNDDSSTEEVDYVM